MSVTSAVQTVPPSEAVVEAVAARRGVDPLDLEERLFEAIDPEALDGLVQSAAERPNQHSLQIEFSYNGYDVIVTSDGSVHLSGTT